MDPSTVLGIAAVVAAFVFVDILFVELRRCVRELNRIARRVSAYGELPIVSLAATATLDAARLGASVQRFGELLGAGEAALTELKVLRRTDAPGA